MMRKSMFVYDHEQDGYRCPEGQLLSYATTGRSGYRHYRSTIQAGGSADNLHIVEEWGRPVRPYGEWRFPYRPYSVPYSQWGQPFGGLGPGGVYAPGGVVPLGIGPLP